MQYFALTDTGKIRTTNEDYVYATNEAVGALENLFLVADGMGGHNAGEVASKLAVDTLLSRVKNISMGQTEAILQDAIDQANAAVYALSKKDEDKAGMGTTLVALSIGKQDICIANVGDSRAYALYEGELKQLTLDHTMVEELFRQGTLSRQAAKYHPQRHVITRALGVDQKVRPDFFHVEKEQVKQILMCTDGLTNMVEEDRLIEILQMPLDVKERATRLLEEANANGGMDNITVIVIDV